MARAYLRHVIQDSDGTVSPGALLHVYEAGTTTPLAQTMYSARSGGVVLSNPLTADSEGVVVAFVDTPQYVTVVATGTDIDDDPMLSLFEPDPSTLVRATATNQTVLQGNGSAWVATGSPTVSGTVTAATGFVTTSGGLDLANAQWERWRNAANSAYLNILRVDGSNDIEARIPSGRSLLIKNNDGSSTRASVTEAGALRAFGTAQIDGKTTVATSGKSIEALSDSLVAFLGTDGETDYTKVAISEGTVASPITGVPSPMLSFQRRTKPNNTVSEQNVINYRYAARRYGTFGDSGTADNTSAAGWLDDSAKAWGTNAYVGYRVEIYSGTGSGQVREVASNTATRLTVTDPWTTPPDATSLYTINDGNAHDVYSLMSYIDTVSTADPRLANYSIIATSGFAKAHSGADNASVYGGLFLGEISGAASLAFGAEIDVVNNTGGAAADWSVTQDRATIGLNVAGFAYPGATYNSVGILIQSSSSPDGAFRTGIYFQNASVLTCAIDTTRIQTSAMPLLIPNNNFIYQKNSANNNQAIIGLTSADVLRLSGASYQFKNADNSAQYGQLDTAGLGLGVAPTSQFHIYGAGQAVTAYTPASGNQKGAAYIVDSGGAGNNGGFLGLGALAATAPYVQVGFKALLTDGNQYGIAHLSFQTRGATGTAALTEQMRLTYDGFLDFRNSQNVALGGGAAPTLGTIGGSGPAAAGQSGWLKFMVAGSARFIPFWA